MKYQNIAFTGIFDGAYEVLSRLINGWYVMAGSIANLKLTPGYNHRQNIRRSRKPVRVGKIVFKS